MDFGPLVPASSSIVLDKQASPGLDLGRGIGPRIYPELPSQESALGESLRILIKRKWVILACMATSFSLVTTASGKMTPLYETGGTIQIDKADTTLNVQQ